MKIIGIDNGVTGSIAILLPSGGYEYMKTPIFKQFNYTKKVQRVSRIDTESLRHFFYAFTNVRDEIRVFLERPMVNPTMFKSSLSAVRAMEATLIVIESFGNMAYEWIDSKEWQKVLLPQGIKGTPNLKRASKEVAMRLFPRAEIKTDGDALLIAEYGRRKLNLNI